MQTVLRENSTTKVKGIAVLSGWMHDVESLSRHLSQGGGRDAVAEEATGVLGTESSAIFWGHGTADEEIPLSLGRDGVSRLREVNGYVHLEFREYEGMGHTTCEAEMRDLKAWLSSLLNS